jgi:hypothetical protein
MRLACRLLLAPAVAAALLSLPTQAQVPVFTSSNQPYVALAGGTTLSFTGTDDGSVVVPLPFPFPWFGATYSQVLVQTNGFISFDTASCTSGCFTNTNIPATGNPNNAIFAWWDDLQVSGGGAVTTHQQGGEFVVQYANVPRRNGGYTLNMQIRLSPAGTVVLHYGTFTGTGGDASVGFEGPGGTQGAKVLARTGQVCTPTSQAGCCSGNSTSTAPFACTLAEVSSGTRILIGEPVEADLSVSSVTLSNLVVLPDNNLTFNLQAQLRNNGQTPAAGFLWRAYLSLNTTLDASDQLVASGGPLSLADRAATTVTAAAATTTPPAPGAYYVLVEVDPTNVVIEASELNNVGATVDTFVSGLDLVAASVTGVAASGGGNVDAVQVNWRNRGTSSPGPVQFRILLSADQQLDANDFVIHTGTRAVTGGETVAEAVQVTMPAAVPNGDFFYLLQLDPANQLTEASKANNVVASSGKVTVRRADLVAEAADFLDLLTGAPVRTARFGEAARARVRVSNQGGANGGSFHVGLVVSNDATLSLLSDTLVCEQLVPLAAAGAPAATVTLSCPLPSVRKDGAPFTTGQYYFFLVVDSRGAVFESNEGNNSLTVGPVRITAPGADLTVTAVTAPASAGVGETVPVVRTLRNLGTLAAPAAAYRYVASVNDIITPDDLPLGIVDAATGAVRAEGSVTLGRDATDTQVELVRLPGSMPPGTYFIGCIVDPLGVVPDLDRGNNARASQSLPVAPSSLRIASASLPDATVGAPFQFRLAAQGEQGTSAWSIDSSQGAPPAWLTLSPTDGTLSGTPTAADFVVFTVKLENAGREAVRRLVLRVLPPTTQVAVTTTALPAVINSSSTVFTFALGAAGGARPYTWRVLSGTLPSGLTLSTDGVLSGTPRGVPNGNRTLFIEVSDATGGRAAQPLVLRLVPPGAIVFRTLALAPALTGQDYLQDIGVQNADGTPLPLPLSWAVSGRLPDGLSLTQQSDIITVVGRPERAGVFTFTLTVTDATGRSDSLAYAVSVYPPRLRLSLLGVAEAYNPGDAVEGRVEVSPAGAVTYAVVSGRLPPGVTMGRDGVLSGAVADVDSVGLWSFVVEARDRSGASGLGSFGLLVTPRPVKQGCGSVDLSGGPLAFAGLLALLRRRRRAVQGGARTSASNRTVRPSGAPSGATRP